MDEQRKIIEALKDEITKLRERIRELETMIPMGSEGGGKRKPWPSLRQKALDALPDLIAIIDRNHRIQICNWHGGYEYVPETRRTGNPTCYEVFYNRKTHCNPCHVMEVFKTGQPVRREKINPKIGWVEVHAYPIRDDSGSVVLVGENMKDITEKKKAQQELQHYQEHLVDLVDARTEDLSEANEALCREIAEKRETAAALKASEEKFRAVAETSPAAIILYQGERFVYANPSAERLTGYSQKELLSMRFWDWIHHDYAEMMKIRGLERQRGTPVPSEYEFKYLTRTGDERWGFVSARCIEFDGKPTGIASFIDITELRNAEELLRESEERFRVMTASAQDAIIMMDNVGRVSFWNNAAERIFGYSREEAMGAVVHKFLAPPSLHERYLGGVARWRTTGQGPAVNRTIELEAMRNDGTVIPIELSLASVLIRGKWNAIAIIRDISDRKRTECDIQNMCEELSQSNTQLLETQEELLRQGKLAVLGQLAGSVGHELRNPLGVICNSVYLLKSLLPDADGTIREYLDIIEYETQNAGKIITDILDFTRTRSPQVVPTEPKELMTDSIRGCSVPENISVSVVAPDSLPLLKIDPQQIQLVVRNLVTNAVQAMPHGGTLVVETRTLGGSPPESGVPGLDDAVRGDVCTPPGAGYVELRVKDTGEGISQENMKKLFQPLFTTKARGIGLGLTVCRNLTEANGGSIRAESRPGEGTEITLTLPVAEIHHGKQCQGTGGR